MPKLPPLAPYRVFAGPDEVHVHSGEDLKHAVKIAGENEIAYGAWSIVDPKGKVILTRDQYLVTGLKGLDA